MKKTTYQIPEIRDEKDNIIQPGTYGKNSPLCNDTNDGVLDYINNNLEYLKSAQDNVQNSAFMKSGGKITGNTEIEVSSAGQYNIPFKIQVPDLKDGEGVYLNLGKEGSTYNRFSFGFEYKTNGASSNAFSVSAFSGAHYTFDSVGNVNFPGSLTVPTAKVDTLTVSGSTSVPTANSDNNSTTIASTAFVKTAIADLIGSAPATLNTLQELSTALGNDANFSATVAKQIGEKVSKNGDTITGPILYSKTPNDDSELINKAYADKLASATRTALSEELSAIKSDMVDIFYPVGTVYMSADKSKTKADFPFMQYGTWEEVPANLCLQTGNVSEAGTQKNAGLPNITGRRVASWGGGDYSPRGYVTGCFKFDSDPDYSTTINGDNWNDGHGTGFSFDASLSNPIYGSSDTVQPPAYMVRAWVRTA